MEAYPALRLQTEEYISPKIQLNSSQALQLFRICQEAITNSCKHAKASQLTVAASSSESKFSISISDNGKGFDLKNDGLEGHYGLQNMKQRAGESNLQLSIESSLGKGTTITISVQE
ncbi:MAG: ATP-binding protein [Bacteroidota bacterium]